MFGVVEVQLMCTLIDHPIPWLEALVIEAVAQPIRAVAIIVPGGLGIQEWGGVEFCQFLGMPEPVAATLWLLKRGREIVFDIVGLLYLAQAQRRWDAPCLRRATSAGAALVVSRLGVGLAADRAARLHHARPRAATCRRRSPDALYARVAEVLDAARGAGIRYVDVARSYGRAEEFLARWLARACRRRATRSPSAASGAIATRPAGAVDAAGARAEGAVARALHERSSPRAAALLDDRLDLYQIHSATAESGCLADAALLAALVDGRRRGAYRAVGLTLSGRGVGDARSSWRARRASTASRVFDVVQATFNVLEPSLAAGLPRGARRRAWASS